MAEGISQNQMATERLRAEARRRSEEVSEQSSKSIEKQQTKNSPTAGFGGENTIGYLTGDGDIVGTTGQVTPVLDRPDVQPVGKTSLSVFESIAATSRQDVVAGNLLLAGDQGNFPPEVQNQLSTYAMQLVVAEDLPPETLQRIESNVNALQKTAAGATDIADMDSVMMALESDFSSSSLKLKGSYQKEVHEKLEVLRKLAPLLNHMVDDASNGYMGKEWKGDNINKLLESYGIDLQLSPDELNQFNELVNKMDSDGADGGGKADKQQREFIEGAIEILLGAMDVDTGIDVQDFAGKIIDTFRTDYDDSAHRMPNGGYAISEREEGRFNRLVDDISEGAGIAVQHHHDAHRETIKIPKHI
ncbi:hypothetical protein [Parendozoicomonas sp. Alg238-R29]|uniref:hypothetical protein n=1 Tax=Parendozoicomonas sp. Alg238-R29 TaxID=2993446 RepID=UPI00248EB19F|nr:hypothetical protein [Parendozoicomonas sp. Alg238-R29]